MIKRRLIVIGILLLPSLVLAEGAYSPGRVTIGTRFDGGKILGAAYNVRYNPVATSNESVIMTFYRGSNSVVSITGHDAASNPFICYITESNYLWPVAQEGMRAAGNGALITASTPPGSSNCDTFVFYKTSAAQD